MDRYRELLGQMELEEGLKTKTLSTGTRANCLMTLILRAMLLLHRQLHRLGADFDRTGGLREQMSATRRAARAAISPAGR